MIHRWRLRIKNSYFRSQKENQERNQYTTHFNVEHYLKIIPNPVEYFSNPNRIPILSSRETHHQENFESDRDYVSTFLCNLYRFHRKKDIEKLLRIYDYDLIKTTARLDRLPKAFKTGRELLSNIETPKNVILLQEVDMLT